MSEDIHKKMDWRTWRANSHLKQDDGREVMVTFALGLSESPTVREAVMALDADDGLYESGMHFGFEGAEYVVALFTDIDGSTYSLVCEWDGSSLSRVEDRDWAHALMELAVQIARRANAS